MKTSFKTADLRRHYHCFIVVNDWYIGLVLDVQKRHELCYTRLLPRVIEDFAAPGAVQFNPRVGKSHVQTLTGARLLKAIVKSGLDSTGHAGILPWGRNYSPRATHGTSSGN